MVDTNQCKMAYDGNEEEYEDFYDYSGQEEGQEEGTGGRGAGRGWRVLGASDPASDIPRTWLIAGKEGGGRARTHPSSRQNPRAAGASFILHPRLRAAGRLPADRPAGRRGQPASCTSP